MADCKSVNKELKDNIVGFAAYYHGKTVASAKSFDELAKNSEVQKLLGKEGFVIKHTVPEGMIAVY